MSEQTIILEASPEVIKEIREAAQNANAQVSKPVSTTSPADALDSPIGGEEVRQIIEFVTIVFKSATAAVAFATTVKQLLSARPQEAVVVKSPASGAKRGVINQDTSEEEIGKIMNL